MATRYERRGVSSSKEEVHAAIKNLDKGLYPGAFCKILSDPAGDPDYCCVKHSDGSGSKIALSYLAWKLGLGLRWWRAIAQCSIVMNTDDVACIGAVGYPTLLTQTINRNPFRISGEVISELVAGCNEFCERLNNLGAHIRSEIIHAGGETADVGDLVRTITLDNDIFVRFPRKEVIDASRIQPGDVIIGFSSTGQAKWEDEATSGVGCNGLTNARHDLLHHDYAIYQETYASEMHADLVYRGTHHLDDLLPRDNAFTIGSALLSRTRPYSPLISGLLKVIPREHIHGLIHCSGGGQTKIGKFGGPGLIYLKDKMFPIPPLFMALQEVGRLPWREMFMAYNMGHRLEAVVAAEVADACIEASHRCGIEARRIGEVLKNDSSANRVVIKENGRQHTYSFA
jgi:phosphoribosylformylglycinamidine cyclo-ligase